MKKKALQAAFPQTIPIFAGFLFLAMTLGIYMVKLGFPAWIPILTSAVVFAGSVEFIAANLMLGIFNPIQAITLAIMVNARHLFYGISMLDKYRGIGKKKLYVIFGMCDETFSINYTADIPEGVDRGWFLFWVTVLNHMYWIFGASIGAIFGTVLKFNTKGLEFVMTAMFIVIFMNQWEKEDNHTSAIIGIVISAVCLIFLGKSQFIIPSMILIVLILTFMKKFID